MLLKRQFLLFFISIFTTVFICGAYFLIELKDVNQKTKSLFTGVYLSSLDIDESLFQWILFENLFQLSLFETDFEKKELLQKSAKDHFDISYSLIKIVEKRSIDKELLSEIFHLDEMVLKEYKRLQHIKNQIRSKNNLTRFWLKKDHGFSPIEMKFNEIIIRVKQNSQVDIDNLQVTNRNLNTSFVFIFLIILILIFGLYFYIYKNYFMVIEKIVGFCQSIDFTTSGRRLPVVGKQELYKISAAINHILDEIEITLSEKLHTLSQLETTERDLQREKVLLKKSLDELKVAQEKLIVQEKLSSFGSLAAGIAHELKNPLNIIVNAGQIMKNYLDEGINSTLSEMNLSDQNLRELEDDFHDLKVANNLVITNGDRANSIIRNMLLLSQEIDSPLEKTNIYQLLETVLKRSYDYSSAKYSVNVSIEKDFEPIEDIYIYQKELGRVFQNILDNAFYALNERFVREEGFIGELKIIAKKDKVDNFLQIDFFDNGAGFSLSSIKKALDPFFTTKPTGAGVGLGLSIANEILIKHEGVLLIQTHNPHYTIITIRIPIKDSLD